jgi:hypothetical protein
VRGVILAERVQEVLTQQLERQPQLSEGTYIADKRATWGHIDADRKRSLPRRT